MVKRIVSVTSAGENKIIVTEEDAVMRRNIVLVKPLSTLKYSTQVNKFDEALVTRIGTITNGDKNKPIIKKEKTLVEPLPTL